MENKEVFDNRLSTIGWGVLLIWWGLRWSALITLPEGSGLLGTSIILLGVNGIRTAVHIPTRKDTTFFGLLSLLSGGILFMFDLLNTPFQPPIFETILIALGVLLLAYGALDIHKTTPNKV